MPVYGMNLYAVGELSVSQLVGLRFASDAELPGLAARALSESEIGWAVEARLLGSVKVEISWRWRSLAFAGV